MGLQILRHGAMTAMIFLAVFLSGYADNGRNFMGMEYPEFKEEMRIGEESISFDGPGRGNRKARGLWAMTQSVFSAHGIITLFIIAAFTAIGFGLAKLSPTPEKIEDAEAKIIDLLKQSGINATAKPKPQGSGIAGLMYLAAFVAGILAVVYLSTPFGGEWTFIIVNVMVWLIGFGLLPTSQDANATS